MAHWKLLGAAAIVASAAMPAAAQTTASLDEARLRAAIAEAELARDAAAAALKKADDAIALLKRALPDPPAALAAQASGPAQPPLYRTSEVTLPADCDRPGKDKSIGAYMLPPPPPPALDSRQVDKDKDSGKQKKEASYDPSEVGSDRGVNAFVYHCLGLTRATDYETITNLSLQFTGTKSNDKAELVIGRTARAIKWAKASDGSDGIVSTYNLYRLGTFGSAGSNGEVPLVDLTTSNFASGIGVLAGFEWGRTRAVPLTKWRTDIHDGIAKARQECIAAHAVIDPLTDPNATSDQPPLLAANPLPSCEGKALATWMSDSKRANQYWNDIVAPLWGYKKDPEIFMGVEGRYAFQDLSYYPVKDPKTNTVIATTWPAAVEIHPEPYSVKLYGGFNWQVGSEKHRMATLGLTGSLSYRREVDFIDGTAGKTICMPAATGANFEICETDKRLAPPYSTTGFVGGVALNLQFKRFWYLPPIALSPRLTYAVDTKRFGYEVPVFLLTDDNGKLNSGFKFTCRLKGETPEGFELKRSCNINLFIGGSFGIGQTP
ncbi:hypothetical protein HZY97_08060 [Sphingomonas sp. R-74633]|uniref:hypothetical protein n=1 Tax=Sphingomonas sp. R-74633 TaxID=2751188 RepID=UPI0015D39073|nr:hypothetical protein [Sphingomonas sp. R-74633]NYT40707.1 hypothetical protein [Sphingomonas sp. R-74633]